MILAALTALAVISFSACSKTEQAPAEQTQTNSVADETTSTNNEAVQDATETVQDTAKEAEEAPKDTAPEVSEAAQDTTAKEAAQPENK